MLSEKSVSNLATILGTDAKSLMAQISSEEEVDITLPSGDFFTEDELSKRDTSKYLEGKDAGVEMLVKNLKKEKGYQFESKNIEDFLNHYEEDLKSKYSKNSDERVKELEGDLTKVKSSYEQELESLREQQSKYQKQLRSLELNNSLMGMMPKETTIKKDAIITLFNTEHDIVEEDGRKFVVKNGQKLKNDKTAEPLEISQVFNEWVVKENFVKTQPGRGGQNETGDSGLSGIKTISKFQEKLESEGVSPNTLEYQKRYSEWRSKNPEATFD